jgi:hypothetical protein
MHDYAWVTAEYVEWMNRPTNLRHHIARKCQGPRKVSLQTALQLETAELDILSFNRVSIIHTGKGETVLQYMP